ncbi:MAG: hypothetical protein AAB438_03525 [Patescibacteria group bacterium]
MTKQLFFSFVMCALCFNILIAQTVQPVQKIKFATGLIFVPQAEFKMQREFTKNGYPIANSFEIQSGAFLANLHAVLSVSYKNIGIIPFYTLNRNSVGISPSISFLDGHLGFYAVASKSLSDGYAGYLGGGIQTRLGGTAKNPLGFGFVEFGNNWTPGGQKNYKAIYVGAFVPLFVKLN